MTKDYVINPDRFKNFFNELDTRRTLLTTVTDLNNKLVNHFLSIEESLNQKSQTLETQIDKFKKDAEKTLESLQIRESALPEKEFTLAARVEQLKDSGINDIVNGTISDGKKKRMSDLLRMWFRRMDSKGLMEYLLANRKKYEVLRMETAMAAEEAIDLFAFVLEAVEDYLELKISGKFGGLAPTRCACGILIQAAFPIPTNGGEPYFLSHGGGGGGGVSSNLKERAAMVMDKWKGVLGRGGGGGGFREDIVASGEAILFLTMVMGFGLKDKFDDEFLKSLMLEVGNRKDMAKLAMALGFGGKEIIDELVNTGKEVEAVYIATEAGLSDLFPPLTLLKSCYSKCQKTFTKESPSRDEIFNESKITREIMKGIEDHKLESEFSMSTMRKRVAHLERLKAEMMKTTSRQSRSPARKRSRSPHNNRSHSNHHRRFDATPSPRAPKSGRVSSTFTAFHRRSRPQPPTHQPAAARYQAAPAPYSYSSPSVYESDPYAVGYGAVHTESHAGYGQYASQDAVHASGSYVNHMNQDGAGACQASGYYDLSAPADVATEATATYPAT